MPTKWVITFETNLGDIISIIDNETKETLETSRRSDKAWRGANDTLLQIARKELGVSEDTEIVITSNPEFRRAMGRPTRQLSLDL